MKARSKINKGLRFQNYLKEFFRKELDINSHDTRGSGSGIDKGDIRVPSFGFNIEAKNADDFSIRADWDQTKRQCTGEDIPVLIIRHPAKPEFEETLVIMEIHDWVNLVKGTKEETKVERNFAPKDRWIVQRCVDDLKKCLKIFEN